MPLIGPRLQIMHVMPSWNTGCGAPPDSLLGSPLALRRLPRRASAGLLWLLTRPVAAGCALRVEPVAGRTLSGGRLVAKSPCSPNTTSYLVGRWVGHVAGETATRSVLRRGGQGEEWYARSISVDADNSAKVYGPALLRSKGEGQA